MQQQLEKVQSAALPRLTKFSPEEIVRRHEEGLVLEIFKTQVSKLAALYQIQSWGKSESMALAEWILDNYDCESIGLICKVLKSPPVIYDDNGNVLTNWRLTPDTFRRWMSVALEDEAVRRENAHHNAKFSDRDQKIISSEELEQIYELMKMPARITELAKEDMKELKKQRFSPRLKFVCKGNDKYGEFQEAEMYAIDATYAIKMFKEAFGKDPEQILSPSEKKP